jgi:2,3-bisphosphoglycerate-independent phosphoglycerate mutase
MEEHKIEPQYRPTVLVICDGWGIAPYSDGNAIVRAKTPNFDTYVTQYPTSLLMSYGEAVGLSWGEMGNSEVGHLNIGAGLVFYQNLPRINKEIRDETFFNNEVLLRAVEHVKRNKSKMHIMGILSSGGVHGHIDHLFALLKLCKDNKIKDVYLHAFMDGRDAVYNSGKTFLRDLQAKADEYKITVHVCTMSGRFYAMDRDNRWERTGSTYAAMVYGSAEVMTQEDPVGYIETLYEKEVYDEQIPPTVFLDKDRPRAVVEDGDSLLFFNFRSDRARQLTKAFAVPGFDKIEHQKEFKDLFFATMVQYEKNMPVEIAFPPLIVTHPFARVVADAGLKQLHIAETEKYAHVTFFLNGGIEEPFEGEDRKVIPSPKVASYDQKPEMKAKEITDEVLKAIQGDRYDVIILNYANPDMVAHTGNLKATIRACEVVDQQIGRVVEAVLARNGLIAITADHGNAEELLNLQTEDTDKEHSVGGDISLVQPSGILADVAPTLLTLMGLPVPDEMTGSSLIDD